MPGLKAHAAVALLLISSTSTSIPEPQSLDHSRLGLPPLARRGCSTAVTDLGERLFFDRHLSADGQISCASCHQPERAFADGLPVARGIGGKAGTRNTPSLLDAALARTFAWDGRHAT